MSRELKRKAIIVADTERVVPASRNLNRTFRHDGYVIYRPLRQIVFGNDTEDIIIKEMSSVTTVMNIQHWRHVVNDGPCP